MLAGVAHEPMEVRTCSSRPGALRPATVWSPDRTRRSDGAPSTSATSRCPAAMILSPGGRQRRRLVPPEATSLGRAATSIIGHGGVDALIAVHGPQRCVAGREPDPGEQTAPDEVAEPFHNVG